MLKEITQEHVVYTYYPEGKNAFGEIKIRIVDRRTNIMQSENDEYGRYANKAKKAILEFVDRENFPLRFTQAWW